MNTFAKRKLIREIDKFLTYKIHLSYLKILIKNRFNLTNVFIFEMFENIFKTYQFDFSFQFELSNIVKFEFIVKLIKI